MSDGSDLAGFLARGERMAQRPFPARASIARIGSTSPPISPSPTGAWSASGPSPRKSTRRSSRFDRQPCRRLARLPRRPLPLAHQRSPGRAPAGARRPRSLRPRRRGTGGHPSLARSRPMAAAPPARGWRARQRRARRRSTSSCRSKARTARVPRRPVHAGIIEPGHFRFTATARRWCASRNVSATCIRASNG